MSTLFGLSTSDPNLLGCELRRLRGEVRLAEEGGSYNAVGVGSYGDDTVLMHRYPSTAMPKAATDLTLPSPSNVLLYHGRTLPIGMSLEDNTQPFRFRHWLFAQSGELPGYRSFKQELWEGLPDHLKRQVRGETDAEIAFAVFLKGLRDVGRTDDRSLDPASTLVLLGETARHLERLARKAAPERPFGIVLVATNEGVMAGCRVGEAPLWFRSLEGRSSCEVHKLVPGSPQSEPMVRAHQRCRSLALASSLLATEGWTELRDGEGIAVAERGDAVRMTV